MPSGRDSVRSDRRRSWPRPKSPSCCTERDRAQSPHQETRSRSRRLSSGRSPIPENMRADSNPEESSRKNLLFFLHSVLSKFRRRARHLAFSYARLTFTSAIRMITRFPNARAARVIVSRKLSKVDRLWSALPFRVASSFKAAKIREMGEADEAQTNVHSVNVGRCDARCRSRSIKIGDSGRS
jgi:hypothetical protein